MSKLMRLSPAITSRSSSIPSWSIRCANATTTPNSRPPQSFHDRQRRLVKLAVCEVSFEVGRKSLVRADVDLVDPLVGLEFREDAIDDGGVADR